MKKKLKKQLTGIVTSMVVIAIAFLLDRFEIINIEDYLKSVETENITETSSKTNINDNKVYEVIRVVDGDTFVINYNGKNEKVRLIGVDTPESVHPNEEKNTEFGDEVSKYSKEILSGKQVVLEFDVQERDKYGRLLAYVYLDDQMYNKLLLEKGYAKIATYPPNVKYVEEFTTIQKQARKNKVGLWAYEEVKN